MCSSEAQVADKEDMDVKESNVIKKEISTLYQDNRKDIMKVSWELAKCQS
jgi:hypothetical protein